jgi:hypothetical protein
VLGLAAAPPDLEPPGGQAPGCFPVAVVDGAGDQALKARQLVCGHPPQVFGAHLNPDNRPRLGGG